MKPRNLRNLFSCIKALRRVTKISAQKLDPNCLRKNSQKIKARREKDSKSAKEK